MRRHVLPAPHVDGRRMAYGTCDIRFARAAAIAIQDALATSTYGYTNSTGTNSLTSGGTAYTVTTGANVLVVQLDQFVQSASNVQPTMSWVTSSGTQSLTQAFQQVARVVRMTTPVCTMCSTRIRGWEPCRSPQRPAWRPSALAAHRRQHGSRPHLERHKRNVRHDGRRGSYHYHSRLLCRCSGADQTQYDYRKPFCPHNH